MLPILIVECTIEHLVHSIIMCARQTMFNLETSFFARFDALIEKECCMYKSKEGPTPRHTTQPTEASLGEQ
jgi:hypothetical protein